MNDFCSRISVGREIWEAATRARGTRVWLMADKKEAGGVRIASETVEEEPERA
jgi:hypothetical protein